MKKTIITFLALCCGVASAATDLIYWGENNNQNLTTVEGSALPYLGNGDGTSRASSTILGSITSKGNTDYNLNFKDEDNKPVSFIVNEALYFNQIYTKGTVSSYTITFGENGSLTAATHQSNWGGAIQFSKGATVTLNIGVSKEQLASLGVGDVFTRTVISSTDTTSNGMWNVTDHLTVKALGLDGYENVGFVADVTALQTGQYGYMKLTDGNENNNAADGISLVFKAIPEPSTATLSLLALCGLATRRRK